MTGHIALVGSGEYLPVMHEVEAALLDAGEKRTGTRRYVQLATAAAPEGDATLRYWHKLGAQAAQRLNAQQVIVDVRNRQDANNPELAKLLDAGALIYLSGGNPVHLAQTLAGSLVGNAIITQWQRGSSIAGCSAGAMALGGHVVDLRHIRSAGVGGLSIVPQVRVLPHFDRWGGQMPDLLLKPFIRKDCTLLGIDEDTAVLYREETVGSWQVMGRQSAWVISGTGRREYPSGATIAL